MQRNDLFLKIIITVYEKISLLWQCSVQKAADWQGWISTTYPKGGASFKEKKLSALGDHHGIIHFVLNCNQTLNADLYSQQLQYVHENLRKYPSLINRRNVLLHDIGRLHWARIMQEKIMALGWSVWAHPLYSPNLDPSDFHLFHSLENALNDRNLSQDQVKKFGKLLQLKTSWILLERNQQATWCDSK